MCRAGGGVDRASNAGGVRRDGVISRLPARPRRRSQIAANSRDRGVIIAIARARPAEQQRARGAGSAAISAGMRARSSASAAAVKRCGGVNVVMTFGPRSLSCDGTQIRCALLALGARRLEDHGEDAVPARPLQRADERNGLTARAQHQIGQRLAEQRRQLGRVGRAVRRQMPPWKARRDGLHFRRQPERFGDPARDRQMPRDAIGNDPGARARQRIRGRGGQGLAFCARNSLIAASVTFICCAR